MLYLASQSPRRKEILKSMKIRFRVVPSSYQEKHSSHLKPHELVLQHSLGKAKEARVPRTARWILGADTIVWAGGRALGKPKNSSQAMKMLRIISGKKHQVLTGIALLDLRTKQCWTGCEVTQVWIKKLSAQDMRDYILRTHPYDKAGGYAIQMKPRIVRKIQGSHSNVVGLPRTLLRSMLRRL